MTKTYDDRCDCKPRFCLSPFAILRWIQVTRPIGILWVDNIDQSEKLSEFGKLSSKLQYTIALCLVKVVHEMVVGMVIAGCLTTVCGSRNCLVITNEFGESNLAGQMYVIIAVGVAIVVTLTLMILYSMNAHRVAPAGVAAMERSLTVVVIIGLIAAVAVECYYAVVANRPEFKQISRAGPIQAQWIAATILLIINIALYIVDFIHQLKPGYPTQYTLV